mgnify:CR=1 FL=1
MDYNALLDLATDLGYELAMSGAETFRVEESITRVLASYGVEAEAFAIPNYLVVSIITDSGKPITRMRRIGYHGNDLDAVEKFNGLSRAFCNRKPDPKIGLQWLAMVKSQRLFYSRTMLYVGNFLGALGFALFFGGNWLDGLCAGVCGLLVGFITQFLEDMKSNPFFRTIAASFAMSLAAYTLCAMGIAKNADAVNIGTLMLLVPGLLFTNAMRDIIYGDTNSGVNRVVQVLLTAMALALGTGAAWNVAAALWGAPVSAASISHSLLSECFYCFLGCAGFAILFNIHGPGALLCTLGGIVSWIVYTLILRTTGNDIAAYFWAAFVSSFYSEIMARVRKYPAISYLISSLLPLIPGAAISYAAQEAFRGNSAGFVSHSTRALAIAGVMSVGILLVVSLTKAWTGRKHHIPHK